jgi:hypothetical protein
MGVPPLSRLAVLKVWSSIRLALQIVARLRRLFVVTAEVMRRWWVTTIRIRRAV